MSMCVGINVYMCRHAMSSHTFAPLASRPSARFLQKCWKLQSAVEQSKRLAVVVCPMTFGNRLSAPTKGMRGLFQRHLICELPNVVVDHVYHPRAKDHRDAKDRICTQRIVSVSDWFHQVFKTCLFLTLCVPSCFLCCLRFMAQPSSTRLGNPWEPHPWKDSLRDTWTRLWAEPRDRSSMYKARVTEWSGWWRVNGWSMGLINSNNS